MSRSGTSLSYGDDAPSAEAVRRMLDVMDAQARDASLAIHPEDDMFAFGFTAVGHRPLAAMAYFRAGISMLDPIRRIAEWQFGSLEEVGSFLDFAGGYGRSTRFLARHLAPDAITVAEIQPDALAFQAREFGVRTLRSAADPAQVAAPRAYDFVFVASLFTHLPRDTFGPWLGRLWEMVAPGGVLVFSTHDEVLDRQGAPWHDGFAFVPANEVSALDPDQYGTSFATETFVRSQLTEWIGPEAGDAPRLAQGLCSMQDLWVVTRGPRNPAPLVHDNGPTGAVDLIDSDGHALTIQGWAADIGFAVPRAEGHAIARIEARVPGAAVLEGELGHPRTEIAAHLGRPHDASLNSCGFVARGRADRWLREDDILTVTAICEHGGRFVLDSTRLDDMFARSGRLLPIAPLARRRRTARTVMTYTGLRGLLSLIPGLAHSEWRRLGRRLRALERHG